MSYVVLFNGYGTGALGDASVVGPFAEREDAESYAEAMKAATPFPYRRELDVEVEAIQAPTALTPAPTLTFKPGDRVEVISLIKDPDPLPVGTTGTVIEQVNVNTRMEQLWVDWDGPRKLALVPLDYPCIRVIASGE